MNEWVFLAVTYDSTITEGENVFFYLGNEVSSVIQSDTGTQTGSIIASTQHLEIGGTPATSNDRTPSAFFNDVRIYDQALSLEELESIRGVAIPEPGTWALMLVGLTGALALGRRR
ncbi:MAG: PEP-CTERM sorting domain-containing protein [Kiritimatiellae bacterium]|nr:PEP-CTERM sorting domain-containing protein [Kiritimatiellia bacterium]